jgi:ferritin-like metal-binding protein YciE
MSKKATNADLKTALNDHLKETQNQVRRLEQAFRHLGQTPRAKACAGMRGIVEEGDEHVGEEFGDPSLRDTMIIGSAQRVEHYEMAAYMGAISHARLLGLDEVEDLLEETLAEEKAADRKLMAIAESSVHAQTQRDDGEDEQGGITGGLAGMVKRTLGATTGSRKPNGARRSSSRKRGARKR